MGISPRITIPSMSDWGSMSSAEIRRRTCLAVNPHAVPPPPCQHAHSRLHVHTAGHKGLLPTSVASIGNGSAAQTRKHSAKIGSRLRHVHAEPHSHHHQLVPPPPRILVPRKCPLLRPETVGRLSSTHVPPRRASKSAKIDPSPSGESVARMQSHRRMRVHTPLPPSNI